MEMQDKEFDQLFNSKLNDFEIEPSEQVWQNIDNGLNGKKTTRSILPYLSIAASVLILASVSFLFYNRSKTKTGQHPVKVVKYIKPIRQQPAPDISDSAGVNNAVKNNADVTDLPVARIKVSAEKKEHTIKPEGQPKQETSSAPEIAVQKQEPLPAVIPTEKPALIQPVITESNVLAATPLLVNKPVEINEAPAGIINDPIHPIQEKTPVKKRARGLGGLINTVIAAVDKREDKLIEFTDAGDDEGTRVTGINLGLFKIKKQ